MTTPDYIPVLSHGPHAQPEFGACLMEMVAFLAGEEHSDSPECVHPTLQTVGINVNDFVSDDNRNRLALLIPIFMNTNDLDINTLFLRVQQEVLPNFYNWIPKKDFEHFALTRHFNLMLIINSIKNDYHNNTQQRHENKVYDDAAIEYLEQVMAIVKDMKGEHPIDISVGINHPSVKANA